MSTTETHHPLWVAYGESGVVGSIRKEDDGYHGDDGRAHPSRRAPTPRWRSRRARCTAHLTPGSDWPEFREH